jgi:hypothetical protein
MDIGVRACGLRNFPFEDFVRNEARLAMVMVAQDLLAWTAMPCLDGALARAEPATLRYQLLHVAAASHGGAGTSTCAGPARRRFGRLRTALC